MCYTKKWSKKSTQALLFIFLVNKYTSIICYCKVIESINYLFQKGMLN